MFPETTYKFYLLQQIVLSGWYLVVTVNFS